MASIARPACARPRRRSRPGRRGTWEDDAAADGAHLVACPADALQAGRDRAGRLHLDDQVDGAHVDAQLQGAGRDHRGQAAGLEVLLDLGALLAADRAVVGQASSVSASSLRLAQSRSARRRELANTIVERWARISSTSRSSMWGQIDAVVGCADDASKLCREFQLSSCPRPGRPPRSNAFSLGGATTVTGRGPPRKRATSSRGRTVADRPMRRAGAPAARPGAPG